jgi:3-methyl-2-oxobutanoate hydroxymethyltransferase
MTSLAALRETVAAGEAVTMVNAYDAATARLVDRSDVEMILVGDSLGITMLGYDGTDRVTVDEMIHHAAAVTRVVEETFVMVDLPFGSYNVTPAEAVRNANRLKKEGGADAVKLEGGPEVAGAVEAVTDAGIPVFGHIGLTPQTEAGDGLRGRTEAGDGLRGRTEAGAERLRGDARAIDEAGAVGTVLELVAADAAAEITAAFDGMTIGIGAGPDCDAQVVLLHDLLGLQDVLPETVAGVRADVGDEIVAHLDDYHAAVASGEFPDRMEGT